MSLTALLHALRDDPRRVAIGDDWLQGRTAYGGASAALALAAAKSLATDLPPLRSAQLAFVGPLAGNVTLTPTLLRRGRNSAYIAVDVTGDDGLGVRALFLFMVARPSAIAHQTLAIEPPTDPTVDSIDGASVGPGFLRNFDLAKAGEREPGRWTRWARLKDREALDAEVELIAIADALPPAALSLYKEFGPVSTTTWQVNVIDTPTTRDGWWLLDAVALHACDGNSSQTMTIWDRDGRAVATATQSVALFV